MSDTFVPTSAPPDLVTFTVSLDGTAIDDTYMVTEIEVNKDINRIPTATIHLVDGSASKGDFPISASDDFKPGAAITITAGYQSDETQIFSGIITRHSIAVNPYASGSLKVECRDKAVKMTMNRSNGFFADKKDSDIISTLIGDSGATADVGATTVTHTTMVQYNCSDWDFMLTRAEANGQIVIVDDGKVTVKAPDTSGSAVFTLTYGSSILSFDGEVDARDQLTAASANAWDPSSQAMTSSSAATPSTNDQGNFVATDLAGVASPDSYDLYHPGALTSDELQAWADARLLRSRMAKVRGTVSCQGSPDLKPGAIVTLAGLGARFNGDAYISGVRQALENGNWVSHVRFGLDPDIFGEHTEVTERPAAALLPGMNGLQCGVVLALEGDPDNEFRIKVDLPTVSNGDGPGVWARLGGFYASNSFGAFFYPEVNDEVIVGFLNDDPRQPVVLGSLYSSSLSPVETPADDNYIKSLQTKSGLRMELDDEKKIITLETPGGHTSTMDDDGTKFEIKSSQGHSFTMDDSGIELKDANGNKITMSSSGIEIKSATALTLSAATTLKGSGDTGAEISGLTVKLSADTTFEAAGSASAKVSSSGIMEISGSLVKIN